MSLNETPSVILPNLKHKNSKISKIRMYDGLFRIFPEREFYSAAMINCVNHWEGYYINAVVHLPK